ncbi:MAG: PHP domain-containing protein, partial [Betaproteobacteria bacterium]
MPTPLRYDLHSHSTKSDGTLTPTELVRRAATRGVDVLALTDHDEVAGLPEASAAAALAGIVLINGTELSVSWGGTTVHIVGLGIDPSSPALMSGMKAIRSGRLERGRLMSASLAQAGIHGAFEGA